MTYEVNTKKIKICIVKLSAMGDIIHAMVALQFIKKAYPNSTIDWIVEEGFKQILQNNDDIDNILPINLKKIKQNKSEIFNQIKILKQYSKNNYNIVIDAQGLLKSAIVARIVGKKIKGSYISGFDKNSIRESISSFFYDKTTKISYTANTIDRNVKVMCHPLGIDVEKKDILNKKEFLFSDCTIENKPELYNLFVIGSTWESRNYPKEKFVQLANELKVKTYIVWGSNEEKEKALWMTKKSEYLNILPKGNLNNLKKIIQNCNILIGNDTGPTHMAWGLNKPSVTIFGPTPVNRVHVTSINKVIKSSSKINHYKLNKNDFSIEDIKVSAVISILNNIK